MTPRSRMPGVFIMGALFVVAVVWWQGCPSGVPSVSRRGLSGPAATEAPERGGQVVASLRAEPRSFNRLVASDQTTDALAMLMQGRLVRINRSTFELEPWLAERWESSADGRTHTLHLRTGVVWSDGTAFTADDVLFSLKRGLRPDGQERRRQQPHGGRPADCGDGPGCGDRGVHLRGSLWSGACGCSTCCRFSRATRSNPR